MKPLTKTQALVYNIIKERPELADNEMDLLDAVWDYDWDETKSKNWNLTRGVLTHPESISRARRKLHEYGLITYSKKAESMRYKAMQEAQAEHGSHYEQMAEIVKPKIRVEMINGEYVTVME